MAVRDFVDQYSALASSIGERIGVSPNILLGQWGLETGWGKSVIPGTNNLGNIKSFDGSGVAATDNMTGSNDNYRQYGDSAAFGNDFASLLERRYKGAIGAGNDAESYAKALKSGGYAEDPAYVKKLITAANMARDAGASDDGRMTGKGNGFDDYFVDSPRGAPKAPRAAISTDGFSNDYFLPETPGAPVSKAGLMSDTGNLLKSGVNQVASGLREAVRQIPVVGDSLVSGADAADKLVTGKTSDEILKGDNDRIQGALSDKMRAALDKKWWNSETQSLGDAWTDPRAYAGGIIQSLPGTLLTMIPAGRLAKMAYEAKVATLGAEEAAKAAARTAMLAGGAGEGLLSAGQTAGDVRDELAKLPQSVWDSSDAYKSLIASGMDDASAKAALTNDAATKGFLIAGVTTAMFGGQGDRVLALAMRGGVSGGIGKRIVKGAIGEGLLEEAPQSYTQEIAKNVGVQTVDPTRQTTEGAFNAALGGLAVGAVQGGGMNALLGRAAPERTAKDAETLSEAATLPVTPVVTPEEIAAIPQAPAELSPREQRQQAVADKLYPLPAQRETASTAERHLEAINAINPLPEQRDGAIGVRQTPFTDAEIAAGVERAQAPARAIEEAYRLNEREQQDAAYQQAQQPQGATPLAFNDAAATPVIAQRSATPTAAPQVTLRSDGQPFATLKAAETSIKARGLSGAVAVSVKGGGFGIRMAAPASAPINVGQANEPANQRIASTVRDDGIQGNIAPTPNAPTQPQPSAQGGSAPTFAGNAMAAGLRDGSGTNLVDAGKPQSDGAGIAELKNEIGWAEQGGRMIRAAGSDGTVNSETISRTKWIPKSDFWPNRPKQGGAITEAQASVAIDKAIAGQSLNARERRFVEYAAKFNAERTLSQPALEQTEKTNETDISEAEYEHYKQTGEPGFGWADGFDKAASRIEALTDDDLEFAASDKPDTPQSLRDGMASLGFTQQEIDDEVTARFGQAQASAQSVAEPTASTAQSTGTSGTQAPPAAEVTKTGDERARDAELFRKTKRRLIDAFTGKSGENFDELSKTLTARANDKNDPQSKLAAEVLDNFDGWKGNYEQRQAFEKNRESANPNEAAAKALESAAAALREVGRPALNLTNPTESKLRTDDAKQKRDAAEKAAKENAPSPEEFGLVGSNRAADVGAAAGQDALFSPNDSVYSPNDDEYQKPRGAGNALESGLGGSAKVSGRTVRALAVTRDLQQYGATHLVGRQVRNPHEVAELAQIYRNPRYEVFRVLFTRGTEIVHASGITLRLPGQTPMFPRGLSRDEGVTWIRDNMLRSGADGYYLLHNHPSGNPTPSREDIQATKLLEADVNGFKGHVIINSGKYSVIGYNGAVRPNQPLDNVTDAVRSPSVPSELLGSSIDEPKHIAAIAKKVQVEDGNVVLIGQSIGGVQIIVEIPSTQLGDAKKAAAIVRRYARMSGSTNVFLSGAQGDFSVPVLEALYKQSFITDVVFNDTGKSFAATSNSYPDEGRSFGVKTRGGGEIVREPSANTIEVDGQQRPRNNSNGKPIAATDEGIRNFWKWFADSRVVDDQGRPLVVYHGTTADFSAFDKASIKRKAAGAGFYFSSNAKQVGYSEGEGANVMPVYLAMNKPTDGAYEFRTDAAYDGLIFPLSSSPGVTHFAVRDPNQIKSTTGNTGQFSPDNADIRFSRAKDSVAAKRDTEYMAAIDAGDMEAAQRIVDQAAVDAGYVSHSDFRMSHQAPDRTETNLGKVKESDLVPADYWTHPEWYQGTPEERESFWQVKSALDKSERNPEFGSKYVVSVYRAIPKNVKEGAIRNGDWVTPSRAYAESEGQQIPGGYRIVMKRARLSDLWWDANSIAELGYDDGKDYAYKNTKNNRKLTDVITRDYDGNIIPPSKRFNYREADARYSRDEQQPATTNAHAADVIAKAAKTVNIPLDVYATPQEASAKLGIYIPSDVRGLFYKGRAALISSNITSPRMAEFVLWHELFHAGITRVAPRYGNEYNRIMQDMAARNSNIIKAARDWRNSYGAETIKRSMEAGLSQEQAEKRMRLMAIEEAIADLAGANVELKGWQQFVAKLQALLRSMGFDNLANWIEGKSNAEVLQLIARTRAEVTTQNLHLTTQVPAFAREEDDASYQRAYHGTPHKFDKFSLDKIGTGEGAQAYGYGLYFASKREIAEHYRNALGRPDSAGLSRAQDLAAWAYSMQSPYAGDAMEHLNDEIARMEKHGKFNDKVLRSDYEEAKRIVASGEVISNGKLYQVDIPEDSEMLHWDKPLSEQPEAVKVALEKSNPALFQKNWYDAETKQPTELGETSGKMLNGVLSEVMDGSEYYRSLSSQTGGGAQASTKLRSLGIRGIKYLDGGSRNAGDGSYNYVVFDDKDVNIEAVHSRADTIEVDGQQRPRNNSNGKPIAATDEGLRNFWKWFGDSKAVDVYGKPLVVYHGAPDARFANQDGTFKTLGERYGGIEPDKRAFWFSKDRRTAATYADDRRAFDYQNAEAGIVDAYIRLENPLIVDANGDYWRTAQRRGKTSDVIAEARAAGNDGAIVRDVKDEYNNIKGTASTTTYTVFSSNQIKSATNNTGQFSPDNADIRFSRNEQTTSQDGDVAFSRTGSGDIFDKNATAAQSTYNGTEAVQGMGMSVKNVMRQTANIARDKRGAALSFLGGRQIADIYSKDVPELPKYNEILQRMQAEQNEGSAVADSIIEKWRVINRKRPEVATQLSSLMHDSTLAQVDPDVSADNAELRKRWINLPQEAKDIYREARDAYVAHFEKVKAELIDRVERSALDTSAKNRTLASMREEFTKAMKGVYFPLARFGDYMVVVKDKAGVTQSVSMAETTNQAQALRAELLRAYPDYIVGAIQKKKEFNAERDGVSRGFMKDLVALISEEPDAQTRDSQLDAINQLWLSSLPDLSWAKSGIHRKGTPGYSNDAMRAFARNMFHGGYHLAKLRYGDRLGDTLAQMQETIDNKVRSNPEYSNVVAQSVVDEMNARHKHVMNPQNTPVANALTGLGFMWHMGLSPASAVVNLSQTALVAYPMLASKFGFGKAATMLLSLSVDAVKGKNDLLSQLQGAEKDAYDRAVREGLIDVTMAHDLAGVSQGKSGEFNEKQQRVMRVASVMFHEAEKFNRGVTFMSAYRLAVQSGVSDPYKLAHDLTFDSHFDYSSQNRPRVMQGPTARVILLFKQYGQNMIYTLSRNTFKALQGDREAQKTLAGLLAMHGMFAGALGLPLMTTLLAAASAIGGSDDEPWDAQVALRNYLADAFGKDIGEVLAHGVFRAPGIKDAIGADISGRVGLDSMLIRMPQETLEGKKYYQALLETIAGPVFGIGGNIANGMQTMAQGNTLRGIEEMLPKSIKDPLKAYRYEQDGIQDKTGITIVDETTIPEEVAQFLGFSPARGMEGFEGKSAIKNQETLLTQRRRQLMQRYGKDAEEGDTADSLTAIQRWNIANPTMAIKGQDLLRSMREKAKRQAEAENGAYLSKKRRGLAELGEFANAE